MADELSGRHIDGHADALRDHGAGMVVRSLDELEFDR